tara:strand:+ start:27141 stop:27569 length:429 start_codon:yes stop_codon:yes gene_type:complete
VFSHIKLLLIFFTFALVNYLTGTYSALTQLHFYGFWFDYAPYLFLTVLFSVLLKKDIISEKFLPVFSTITFASISGYVVAELILIFQWYWFVHPEYRNVPGDMSEGIGFTVIFTTVWCIAQALVYLLLIAGIKSISKNELSD